MKVIKDEAIIVETIPMQGANILVNFFSKDFGMMKGVAEGARRVKSRFGGCFELLNYVAINYFHKENEELVKINECELKSSIISREMGEEYCYAIFYIAELIREFGTAGKNSKLFDILRNVHYGLKRRINLGLLARWYELQLLSEHGSLSLSKECIKCKRGIVGVKYLCIEGGIRCDKCADRGDIKLAEKVFILMSKLLSAKIEECDGIVIDDSSLKIAGKISKLLIEHCLEKPLRFYEFYKQVKEKAEGKIK